MALLYSTIIIATVFSGLLAGVFFTWNNAITPGIARLSDIEYLSAFQAMNRTILNPLFYLVFLSPILFSSVAAILQYNLIIDSNFWSIILSMVTNGVGVIWVTFRFNIPLNKALDKIDLTKISTANAKRFRQYFEGNWNRFHFIRVMASLFSFIILTTICLFIH